MNANENKIEIGQKVKTISGIAQIVEICEEYGSVKIKHDMPNGNGLEEWYANHELKFI